MDAKRLENFVRFAMRYAELEVCIQLYEEGRCRFTKAEIAALRAEFEALKAEGAPSLCEPEEELAGVVH